MPPDSLILPFTVPDKDGAESFTLNMEVAAVLFLAEAKKRKMGLLESPRKTAFVSKVYYPLWVVPWENSSLVLDGLDVFSTSIICQALPDLTSFIEDVKRGSIFREQFWKCIEKHRKIFVDFEKSFEVKVDALISSRELLSAIFEYVKDAASIPSAKLSVTLAPPKLSVQAAVERAKQVFRLQVQIRSEIKALEYCISLLREAASFHEKMILKEIEAVEDFCDREIFKLKPHVESKVYQLQEELEAEIIKMEKIFEKRMKTLEQEKASLERKLQALELKKADMRKRLEMLKRKKDKKSLVRWEYRVCEGKIRELKKRINGLVQLAEENRKRKEAEIGKLRRKYQELMDEEKSKVSNLEFQRDEKCSSKQKEMEKLKFATSQILNQIEQLANRKIESEKELKGLVMPWRNEDVSLICLPFYIVGYQNGNKTQLKIIPPLKIVSLKGVVKVIRKTLLGLRPGLKVNLFLKPRSSYISEMLNSAVKKAVKSDKVFSEILTQTAVSANILAGHKFRETLVKGLEELKAGGWIGQKEADVLADVYLKEDN